MDRRFSIRLGKTLFLAMLSLFILGGWVWFNEPPQLALAAERAPFDGSTKTVDLSEAPPGGVVEYTIMVENNTGALATPTITDDLDSRLYYVSNSFQASSEYCFLISEQNALHQVVVSCLEVVPGTGGIAPGESVTITFQAQTSVDTPQGSVISNTAQIANGADFFETDPVTVTIGVAPTVRIDNPVDGDLITQTPGSTLKVEGVAWTTSTPPFPEDPNLLPITDYVPSGAYASYTVEWEPVDAVYYVLEEATNRDFDGATPPAGCLPPIENTTECAITKLDSGDYYYRVRAHYAADRYSRWSNVQSISVTLTSRATEAERLQFQGESQASPRAVETILQPVVLITVTNVTTGFVQYQGRAMTITTHPDGLWEWAYDWVLPKEDKAAYTIEARAGYEATDVDYAFYGEPDSITVIVSNGFPILNITKEAPASTFVGGAIDYTLTVSNTGRAAAENLVITDTIPTNSEYLSATQGGELLTGDIVSWSVDSLAVGEVISVQLKVKALRVGSITNDAYGAYAEGGYSTSGEPVNTTITRMSVHLPLTVKRWPPYPYTPTLNPIDNADGDENYSVSWAYNYDDIPSVAPNYYELLESTDLVNWGTLAGCPPESPADRTSCSITGKNDDTYYYIVRGRNSYNLFSPWSNVESATVVPPGFRDDFGSSHANWKWRRGDDIDETSNFIAQYKDGKLYTGLVGSYDFGVLSPMVEAPEPPYMIKTRFRLVDNETVGDRSMDIRNGTTFGVVFGGNGGSPCPANRDTAKNTGCFSHYYRVMLIWAEDQSDGFRWNFKRMDYHDPDDDGKAKEGTKYGDGFVDVGTGDGDWHEIWIEVTTTRIKIYVDGIGLASTTDMRFIDDPYFGLHVGSPDIGDTAVKWDWFEIKRQ